MKKICITGGIGAGKSVYSRILRLDGKAVYDCDYEARRLMDADETLAREIGEKLGEGCLCNGSLDRKAIATCIFADDSKRDWLNARVHEMVKTHLGAWLEVCEKAGLKEVWIETAIPNTSGITQIADEIWLVTAPEETRIARIRLRDGSNPEEIRSRMQAQQGEFENFGSKPVKIIPNYS